MANRTVSGAKWVRGMDPQLLVEKIIRDRIYESTYWKEHCFGLTISTLLDRAVLLDYVGGTHANIRPSPFLCLLLKMLQLSPERDIIDEMINHEAFKYIRVLACTYLRLTAPSLDIFRKLEPLLKDRRKIRKKESSGQYTLTYVDEIIDELLTKERVFDIMLPRLTKRELFVQDGELVERENLFKDDLGDLFNDAEKEIEEEISRKGENEGDQAESVVELSIEETNAIRAKLGLKPLSQ